MNLKVVDTALAAPGPGKASGRTPGTPAVGSCVEDTAGIHYHVSDRGTLFETFCLNMKRLLILSMTNESNVIWISWNYVFS